MSILTRVERQWTRLERRWVKRLLRLVTPQSNPNLNELAQLAKDMRIMALGYKATGYELARRMASVLPIPEETEAMHAGLRPKASTQADIESPWAAHWAGQLKLPVIYHRKLWELTYIMQVIHEHGYLREGTRGVGFGCGIEPLPSYLASQGVEVTITDLDQTSATALGWINTNQYASTLDHAFHPRLVSRETFDRNVKFRVVDMNDIPPDLVDYDFCWSTCAVEHLGSISKGLHFIKQSLQTLKPGGLSVHTVELNIENDGPTIDNWGTVLFQRKHMEKVADDLRRDGHFVADLDFNYGDGPLDRFIDIPPYQGSKKDPTAITGQPLHLKLGVDGFVATCFGIIVRKAG